MYSGFCPLYRFSVAIGRCFKFRGLSDEYSACPTLPEVFLRSSMARWIKVAPLLAFTCRRKTAGIVLQVSNDLHPSGSVLAIPQKHRQKKSNILRCEKHRHLRFPTPASIVVWIFIDFHVMLTRRRFHDFPPLLTTNPSLLIFLRRGHHNQFRISDSRSSYHQ